MAKPLKPGHGGFKKRVQLGLFIRDTLSLGDAVPHAVYEAYKAEVQSEPSPDFERLAFRRIRSSIANAKRTKRGQRVKVDSAEIKRGLPAYMEGGTVLLDGVTVTFKEHKLRSKRKCCSYNSFMHYIYILKKLGLVEDTGDQEPAAGKAGSQTGRWHQEHLAGLVRAVPSGLGSDAWNHPWEAYLGYRPVNKTD